MENKVSTFWLVKNSIVLDWKFIKNAKWNLFTKLHFLVLRNYLIIKHFFVKFELGRSSAKFMGKEIFYDTKYGLAGYERMLSTHRNLLHIGKVEDVKVVVDIGANVGFFSRVCRQLYKDCNIYAIEPVPRTFKCLQNNYKGDRKTKVFQFAISDSIGTVKMMFDPNFSSESIIDKKGNTAVKQMTLDQFAKKQKINRIDLLKIDTETFESHVLRGGKAALANTHYLFMEISLVPENRNYTISSLLGLLHSKDFDFQLIAFRNFEDKGEGEIPTFDALFINQKILNK